MVMLVQLEEAKGHLRQIADVEDDEIVLQIQAASAAVMNYLKCHAPAIDLNGEVDLAEVRPEHKQATLYLLGMLYRDRDGQGIADWQPGYLPAPVVSILYPLRDPAMA